MFTWEGRHKWGHEGPEYRSGYMLLGYRYHIPIWLNYADRSGNPKEPDWHEETISLSYHSSNLPSNIESVLREFKGKHKLNFKCHQDFDEPWKSVIEWKIEEISEN